MQHLRAVPTRQSQNWQAYVNEDLAMCTHLFIRNVAVRKPLQPPYDGPFLM